MMPAAAAAALRRRPFRARSGVWRRWVMLLAWWAVCLAAAGCSSGETPAARSTTVPAVSAVSEPADAVGDDDAGLASGLASADVRLRPGDGVVVAAGLDWGQWGRFRAELYRLLLGELGYEVSEPWEVGPNAAYLWMAAGELDYWTDGRFPSHDPWLDGVGFDGSRVGDRVSAVGAQMHTGYVMGWLISKTFADEHGVTTMDGLNRDPAALAAFDAADAMPGNGKADVFSLGFFYGDIVASQAALSGWRNIAFVELEYPEIAERAIDAADADAPMITLAWAPSALAERLVPGADVYWLGVEQFLDDSNPLGIHQGELFSQATRGHDGTGGYAPINAQQCPAAASRSDGQCPLGWAADDIAVAASNDFLAANPPAAALLEAVTLPPADASQALAQQSRGSDPATLAAEWITANRPVVEAWLAEALHAATPR